MSLTTCQHDTALPIYQFYCWLNVKDMCSLIKQISISARQQGTTLNTLRPRQNGRHFADGIFKCILLNENVWITITDSLTFVPNGLINNIPALVQIMIRRRPGDKPLSEPMLISLPTHICVIRPQWVKELIGGGCEYCSIMLRDQHHTRIHFSFTCDQNMDQILSSLFDIMSYSWSLATIIHKWLIDILKQRSEKGGHVWWPISNFLLFSTSKMVLSRKWRKQNNIIGDCSCLS